MGWLKLKIRQIFLCKHQYDLYNQLMINGGMGKMFIHKCRDCGKEKVKFL